MMPSFRVLPLLAAVALAGVATAQDSFDFRASDVGILQFKEVQKEMNVSEAQRTKMNKSAEAHTKRLQAYQKQLQVLGQAQPDQRKLMDFFSILKKEVLSTLSTAQLKRLRELTLQRLGIVALTDEAVAKKVGLSSSQVDQLRKTLQTGRDQVVSLRQKTEGPILAKYQAMKPQNEAEKQKLMGQAQSEVQAAQKKAAPQMKAISQGTDAKMLGVLTAKQKAVWTALKGKPFKAK